MDDLISRQVLLAEQFASLECILQANKDANFDVYKRGWNDALQTVYDNAPSAQPEDWIERNKERILQAGMEGREIEFRIGGRLFAIREKAQ
jgi:hypothetical protein